MPPRILTWALDGEARPAELMEHSTLRHSAAWHAAYGAVATIHHAHALASQQFAIGAGRFRGLPSEESVPMRGVPPGWVQRVKFFIGCGTNTSSAKRLVIASAAVYMPLEPGGTFCYVMPLVRAKRSRAPRAPATRPCKSAC